MWGRTHSRSTMADGIWKSETGDGSVVKSERRQVVLYEAGISETLHPE